MGSRPKRVTVLPAACLGIIGMPCRVTRALPSVCGPYIFRTQLMGTVTWGP